MPDEVRTVSVGDPNVPTQVGTAGRTLARGRGRLRPEHPDRDMKCYTVTANEMMIMGASSALGSFALYGATYFFGQWRDLSKKVPPVDADVLATTYGAAVLCGVMALLFYALLGGVIVRIKRESGVPWLKILF